MARPLNEDCRECPNDLTILRRGAKSVEECVVCPPGTGFNFDGTCTPCREGTYNLGDRGICVQCPPGQIPTDREGSSTCTNCPLGTTRQLNKRRCRQCPTGFTTLTRGSMVCVPKGATRCPSSFHTDANGSCILCAKGSRLNPVKKI